MQPPNCPEGLDVEDALDLLRRVADDPPYAEAPFAAGVRYALEVVGRAVDPERYGDARIMPSPADVLRRALEAAVSPTVRAGTVGSRPRR